MNRAGARLAARRRRPLGPPEHAAPRQWAGPPNAVDPSPLLSSLLSSTPCWWPSRCRWFGRCRLSVVDLLCLTAFVGLRLALGLRAPLFRLATFLTTGYPMRIVQCRQLFGDPCPVTTGAAPARRLRGPSARRARRASGPGLRVVAGGPGLWPGRAWSVGCRGSCSRCVLLAPKGAAGPWAPTGRSRPAGLPLPTRGSCGQSRSLSRRHERA